jgi:hypothetical protein
VYGFGLKAAGHDEEKPYLRLCSQRARAALARYFNALDEALGWGWLERPHTCTVADCVRAGLAVAVALPCVRFNCPNNLTGHIDRFGLPVLYHRQVGGRPVCILQLGAEPTLHEVGAALGVSRERCRQIETVGKMRAEVRARHLGLVVSCRSRVAGRSDNGAGDAGDVPGGVRL